MIGGRGEEEGLKEVVKLIEGKGEERGLRVRVEKREV